MALNRKNVPAAAPINERIGVSYRPLLGVIVVWEAPVTAPDSRLWYQTRPADVAAVVAKDELDAAAANAAFRITDDTERAPETPETQLGRACAAWLRSTLWGNQSKPGGAWAPFNDGGPFEKLAFETLKPGSLAVEAVLNAEKRRAGAQQVAARKTGAQDAIARILAGTR